MPQSLAGLAASPAVGVSVWVLAALVLAAFVAGWVDSVVGGGGLIQLPALVLGLPADASTPPGAAPFTPPAAGEAPAPGPAPVDASAATPSTDTVAPAPEAAANPASGGTRP